MLTCFAEVLGEVSSQRLFAFCQLGASRMLSSWVQEACFLPVIPSPRHPQRVLLRSFTHSRAACLPSRARSLRTT